MSSQTAGWVGQCSHSGDYKCSQAANQSGELLFAKGAKSGFNSSDHSNNSVNNS